MHLTSVHSPKDVRIFHRESRTLVHAGYEVIVVAPHEQNEQFDQIRIQAVSRPRNRLERMSRTLWKLYQAAMEEEAQVYHFHDPELLTLGLFLKLRGKKVVYDAHEDFPRQVLSKEWLPAWVRPMLSWISERAETMISGQLDGIVAATSSIAARFPRQKTAIVRNFPLVGELTTPTIIPYSERPLWVVYVGGLAKIRGFHEMLHAMTHLSSQSDARLVLAGSFFPPELETKAHGLPGWERTQFVGWQDRAGLAHILGQARVGLVLLHPTPNYLEALPIKLFEYMSAGIPVIASDFTLWRQIVEESGCGLLVDPLKPDAIAEAIQWVLEHPEDAEAMGQRGQEAVARKYNWSQEGLKLLEFYEMVLEKNEALAK